MTRIGLISDTHGYLDEQVFKYFENCDQVWHGGDFGDLEVANRIKSHSAGADGNSYLKGVFGNIDGQDIRAGFPEQLIFMCEEVKVMIRHIGGSPPRYNPETRKELSLHQPQLFITGHSHILKVMYDPAIKCLYINPGAAGKQGWHKVRTIITLIIDGKEMKDCKVIELGKR